MEAGGLAGGSLGLIGSAFLRRTTARSPGEARTPSKATTVQHNRTASQRGSVERWSFILTEVPALNAQEQLHDLAFSTEPARSRYSSRAESPSGVPMKSERAEFPQNPRDRN